MELLKRTTTQKSITKAYIRKQSISSNDSNDEDRKKPTEAYIRSQQIFSNNNDEDRKILRRSSDGGESSGDNNNNVKRRISNGRRLKRPSNGPPTPLTPKDEYISHLERTRSLNSQPLECTRSIGQPLERTRSFDQHLERARAGLQLSSSRRSSLRDGSTILAHSRQSSSTSMGFHLESGDDSPRDSGYFSSGDKRRSQSSMARRGSKDITAAYHMRQSSYGRNSPDSDDAASVTSTTSEREKRALMSHHIHTRSETLTGDNVFDRLLKSQAHSSTTKKYNSERRGSVDSIISVSSVTRGYPGGVEDTLAALEARREEYAKSPVLAANKSLGTLII
ncbi:unnamed protein product [Rhizophagus irregularis]|nr:unnamed protein product [Rhizophagus irregularis]CAB4439665.1 unnamed protein product [Rhizophagus irregularis]